MGWALTAAMLFNLPHDPFTYASQATGVPAELLVAISRVESSHHPWALNIDGIAVYPKSQKEAEEILNKSPDNVDIGHMQVNYRIWGRRLGFTKVQLLDPHINAWAGTVILRYYLSRYPFWEAVGRYHSADRGRQIRYAWRVYQALLPNSESAR